MQEEIQRLLKQFGYIVKPNDKWLLDFAAQKVEMHIKHTCNVEEIPKGLKQTAVQMAAGEFLLFLKSSNQLDIEAISLENVAKSIQEGDTSVTFSIGEGSATPEQRLNQYIDFLMNPDDSCFASYRKLVW